MQFQIQYIINQNQEFAFIAAAQYFMEQEFPF